jgi:hypothetical protein
MDEEDELELGPMPRENDGPSSPVVVLMKLMKLSMLSDKVLWAVGSGHNVELT